MMQKFSNVPNRMAMAGALESAFWKSCPRHKSLVRKFWDG